MSLFLHDFVPVLPRFRTRQEDAFEWLAQAHANAGHGPVERLRREANRYGCSPARIVARGHELEDFTHLDWSRMRIYPNGGLEARTQFFAEAALAAMPRFYPSCQASQAAQNIAQAPDALIHVSCTGYDSPSAAQRWVASQGWQCRTQVYHVYHMGCYAAMPAIRVAAAHAGPVDVIHTELCTLHLDLRGSSPEAWVQQSLFGDGLIRYRVERDAPRGTRAFEVLANRDLILTESAEIMKWTAADHCMRMVLGREIPERIQRGLKGALEVLLGGERAVNQMREKAIWAIHPGGPRIVDEIQRVLELEPRQVRASAEILREHGNMSSATLPHVWHRILEEERAGTPVVSLAFGPGLTISGALMKVTEASG